MKSFSPLTIIGIDEAGRGAWAGPVVAAAVSIVSPPQGVRDSKVLSASQRETLYAAITDCALFGVGVVSAAEIDAIGIKAATNKAMNLALAQVLEGTETDHHLVLIDGNDKFTFPVPYQSFIRGDSYIRSVGCASIVAKVHRDRLMTDYHEDFASYGFHQHKGYGTAQHQRALANHGPCSIHRMSYAPLRLLTSHA